LPVIEVRLFRCVGVLGVSPLLTTPFYERYPHTRISLELLFSREITRRLTEFELDIAMAIAVDAGERISTVWTV
jgi:hypothetical protein